MESLYLPIAKKISLLVKLLKKSKQELEIAASDLKEQDVKSSVIGIALETNQYAEELSGQLKMLGIEDPIKEHPEEVSASSDKLLKLYTKDSIFIYCHKSEKKFIKAYTDILNEYFPYQSVRSMMIYQLNEIRCAFMRMHFLAM